MPHFTVTAELNTPSADFDGTRFDRFLTALEPWHIAVGTSPYGNAEAVLTVPADDTMQAAAAALAFLRQTGEAILRLEVLSEDVADARAEDVEVPDLVDPAGAGEIIGVSRVAVIGMVERGELPAERFGQRGTAIARRNAERLRDRRLAK